MSSKFFRETCKVNRVNSPCGKSCYFSKTEAKKAAKQFINSGKYRKRPGQIMHPYYCSVCDAYHNGHTEVR